MFEIREEKDCYKGWFRIWIQLENGEWMRSRRYSTLEKAQEQLNVIKDEYDLRRISY